MVTVASTESIAFKLLFIGDSSKQAPYRGASPMTMHEIDIVTARPSLRRSIGKLSCQRQRARRTATRPASERGPPPWLSQSAWAGCIPGFARNDALGEVVGHDARLGPFTLHCRGARAVRCGCTR